MIESRDQTVVFIAKASIKLLVAKFSLSWESSLNIWNRTFMISWGSSLDILNRTFMISWGSSLDILSGPHSSEKRSTFSHLVHTSNLMSHLKPIDKLYLSNKYMNHGDRSSNDKYYLPCITMYLFLKYYNLCGNNFLMNKPYVYSWSNTNEFS